MPYTIKKEKCKKSDGGSGSHRLRYTDKSGKKHSSCHSSKKSAQGSIAAIEMRREVDEMSVREEVMSEILLRETIRVILSEAGVTSERQEQSFISIVNQHAKHTRNGITVSSEDRSVDNVIGAEKYSDRAASGSEPYTDIVLFTKNGAINISAKGPSAPSIAGGGLSGMEAIVPGLVGRFLETAEAWYIENGYKKGDIIPDIYGKLNNKDKKKIVIGTSEMGGPIDFMYIGPMEVSGMYDQKTRTLSISGALTSSVDFAKNHDIFLRLRKRRVDQPFAPGMKDSDGMPLILGRSPSRGDMGRRIVATSSVPSSAVVVAF